MTSQLELFTRPAEPAPPRFDADAVLRSLPRNTEGTCCGHWKLQHEQVRAGIFEHCRFCDCQQFTDQPTEPPCCRTGLTGHCAHGRHDQCPYSPGGACYGGIIRTQYVLVPPAAGWPGTSPTPNLHLGNAILADIDAPVRGHCDVVELVEPAHRIVCGCDCHDEAVGHA